jgi:hypothetical protein
MIFDTDAHQGIVFAGKLGLTEDQRSITVVGDPVDPETFESLRDRDVIVLVSSSPLPHAGS